MILNKHVQTEHGQTDSTHHTEHTHSHHLTIAHVLALELLPAAQVAIITKTYAQIFKNFLKNNGQLWKCVRHVKKWFEMRFETLWYGSLIGLESFALFRNAFFEAHRSWKLALYTFWWKIDLKWLCRGASGWNEKRPAGSYFKDSYLVFPQKKFLKSMENCQMNLKCDHMTWICMHKYLFILIFL